MDSVAYGNQWVAGKMLSCTVKEFYYYYYYYCTIKCSKPAALKGNNKIRVYSNVRVNLWKIESLSHVRTCTNVVWLKILQNYPPPFKNNTIKW